MSAWRRFEFKDGKSDKFWEIECQGDTFHVRYGRTGTSGTAMSNSKSFASEEKAQAAAESLIAEKLAKGYVEGCTAASSADAALSAPDQGAPGFFASLIADEKTYDGASTTVEYVLLTVPLGMSIERWFEVLWSKLKQEEDDDDKPLCNAFVKDTLGVYAFGLGSAYESTEEDPPEQRPLKWTTLTKWLDKNLIVEMNKKMGPHSIAWGDNAEFDCIFCFYTPAALNSGELSLFFAQNAAVVSGPVTKRVRLSAYLENVEPGRRCVKGRCVKGRCVKGRWVKGRCVKGRCAGKADEGVSSLVIRGKKQDDHGDPAAHYQALPHPDPPSPAFPPVPALSPMRPPLVLPLLAALLLAPPSAHAQSVPPLKPPNIILYVADDLGFGEVNQDAPQWGFPFNPLSAGNWSLPTRPADPTRTISTPNLARVARGGARALMSYASSSECAPTRASILVGRQVGSIDIRGDTQTNNGYNPDINEPGFVAELAAAGYDTAMIGKWGLGSKSGAPWLQGFSYFAGQLNMVEAWAMYPQFYYQFTAGVDDPTKPYTSFSYPFPNNVAHANQLSEQFCAVNNGPSTHSNDFFRDRALEYVQEHNSSNSPPFFLYWAPTIPHLGTYQTGGPLSSPVKRLGSRNGTLTECRRGHAAGIEQHIDTEIGMLLNLLASTPSLNNTLVVFTSDNGPHGACDNDAGFSPSFFLSSGGLRGMKATMYEGGLRAPTMYFWPGVIQPGSVILTPHALYDLAYTFLDAAGLPYPGSNLSFTGPLGSNGGGASLLPILKGTATSLSRTWLHFELCLNNVPTACSRATIDLTSWLKIITVPGSPIEVYDLLLDPTESTNLAPTLPPPVLTWLQTLDNNVREPLCPNPPCARSTWTPSLSPSMKPTMSPATMMPTSHPTTSSPTSTSPTTLLPSASPTWRPTSSFPTSMPTSAQPTSASPSSTKHPSSSSPTRPTTHSPTPPTFKPTHVPTNRPTSKQPTFRPSLRPTRLPTILVAQGQGTEAPGTSKPTKRPTRRPTRSG